MYSRPGGGWTERLGDHDLDAIDNAGQRLRDLARRDLTHLAGPFDRAVHRCRCRLGGIDADVARSLNRALDGLPGHDDDVASHLCCALDH